MEAEEKKETTKNNSLGRIERYLNILEFFFWLASGITYAYYMWVIYFEYESDRLHYSIADFASLNAKGLLLSIALIIIPILSLLVFGNLPISGIRSNIRKINLIFRELTIAATNEVSPLFLSTAKAEINKVELPKSKAEIFENQTSEARQISEKIYQRSGTYLFVGSIIAIFGVFSFYIFNLNSHVQSGTTILQISDKVEIINFLQRVSILIFIEFVAFFFLRQYKVLLEEYRYYESIKRKRQDNYLIVSLAEAFEDKPELLKTLLEKCSFSSERSKLGLNETTETLEVQKMTKDDFNIVDKLIDSLKEIKGK